MKISPSVWWCSTWSSPPPCAASCPSTLPSRPSHGGSRETPSLREKKGKMRTSVESVFVGGIHGGLWDRRAAVRWLESGRCDWVLSLLSLWGSTLEQIQWHVLSTFHTLLLQQKAWVCGSTEILWLWRRIPLSLLYVCSVTITSNNNNNRGWRSEKSRHQVQISEQIKETTWGLDVRCLKWNCMSTCHPSVNISHHFVDSRLDWKKSKHNGRGSGTKMISFQQVSVIW